MILNEVRMGGRATIKVTLIHLKGAAARCGCAGGVGAQEDKVGEQDDHLGEQGDHVAYRCEIAMCV